MTDRLLESLGALPSRESDARRAEQLRKRCRAMLLAQQTRPTRRPTPRALWPPLAGAACAVYLATAVIETLRMYGVF